MNLNEITNRKELKDEQRKYPQLQKDGMITEYKDGTRLSGSWARRIDDWIKLNLHRIKKGY